MHNQAQRLTPIGPYKHSNEAGPENSESFKSICVRLRLEDWANTSDYLELTKSFLSLFLADLSF